MRTAPRPRHAQPSALATLGWTAMLRWAVITLLAAVVLSAAAALGTAPRRAAAGVPAPVKVAITAAQQLAHTGSTTPASNAPSSSTIPSPPARPGDDQRASSLASDGIPTTALEAYQRAARRESERDPSCGLSWPLLAAIGRVESDHGRFAGAVLHTDGRSTPRVIGIALTGQGTARITDTDGGRLDGDQTYDRAVGPMQFIPSTWAGYRADGNGDGIADPFNIFDAAAAAAHYLCAAGGDLTTLAGQLRAVHAYNDSDAYVALVLQLERVYARGVPGLTVPIVPSNPSPPKQHPTLPPVNPGPPLGAPSRPKKPSAPKPGPSSAPKPTKSPSGSSCPTPTSTVPATKSPTGTATASKSTGSTSSGSSTASRSTSPTTSSSSCPSPTGSSSTSTSASATASATTTTSAASSASSARGSGSSTAGG
jgi:membrane-bound lytic murein transglycosylase B